MIVYLEELINKPNNRWLVAAGYFDWFVTYFLCFCLGNFGKAISPLCQPATLKNVAAVLPQVQDRNQSTAVAAGTHPIR